MTLSCDLSLSLGSQPRIDCRGENCRILKQACSSTSTVSRSIIACGLSEDSDAVGDAQSQDSIRLTSAGALEIAGTEAIRISSLPEGPLTALQPHAGQCDRAPPVVVRRGRDHAADCCVDERRISRVNGDSRWSAAGPGRLWVGLRRPWQARTSRSSANGSSANTYDSTRTGSEWGPPHQSRQSTSRPTLLCRRTTTTTDRPASHRAAHQQPNRPDARTKA